MWKRLSSQKQPDGRMVGAKEFIYENMSLCCKCSIPGCQSHRSQQQWQQQQLKDEEEQEREQEQEQEEEEEEEEEKEKKERSIVPLG